MREGVGLVLVLAHGANEGAALLESSARQRGLEVVTVRVDEEGDRLPDGRQFDAVFVMGSDQSVYDEGVGWIQPELAMVRQAVTSDVPVLGVCFGGQLLAQALGGTVGPAVRPELGWLRLETGDPLLIPPGPWLAWHGDAFTAPPGAQPIAWSDVCLHAFTSGPHLGLQFHPEVTTELLAEWFDDAERHGFGVGPIQESILAQAELDAVDSARRAAALLDAFLRRSGRAAEASPESKCH
jgi:GMP synthase (glutamine-hydrolysing)